MESSIGNAGIAFEKMVTGHDDKILALERLPAGPSLKSVKLAVILCAGEGNRLFTHGNGKPKPTVSLLGLSLGERAILSCMDAGIWRFVVVLGHQENRVRLHFEQIATARGCEILFVEASKWHLGNGASALAAADVVGESRFVLCMADHVVDPQLIRAVCSTYVQEGEILLAIDRDRNKLVDVHDATKVKLDKVGKVERIGKHLDEWDAADTGVFLCTRGLFKALAEAAFQGKHGLSAGVAVLAEHGAVRTVDGTGLRWIDVDTPRDWKEARRQLLSRISEKGEDGFVSRWINRQISVQISAWLSFTSITPNQITIISFLMALVGAVLLAMGETLQVIAGGLMVQMSSIVDGCDGEIARLKHWATNRGAWLDTMLDRYADIAVTLAITLAYARHHPSPLVWLGGMVALSGFILAGYVTKEYKIRHGRPYPNDLVNRLKRRDLRLLGISIGAVAGYPYVAMMVLGFLSHACVFGILVRGWRLQNPRPADRNPQVVGISPVPSGIKNA